MILFKQAKPLSAFLAEQEQNNRTIGFVPTMGALHPGHMSLLSQAKKETGFVVCSIFVNPTQFNSPDDFKNYPITLERDIERLVQGGCDALFLPTVAEIYPEGYAAKHYALESLEAVLEGKHRPGHFQGVCQVVDRLLEIVPASHLYVGQKDFQQCKVIQKLLSLTNRTDVSLCISPTVREANGLAMSSRNLRLNSEQRAKAPALFKALQKTKEQWPNKPTAEIEMSMTRELEARGFRMDYFSIVDRRSLLPATNETIAPIALVAAFLDSIRLIDNLPLN